MLNAQLIEILIVATVAGIIAFRLYLVLGRRTGNERPPQNSPFSTAPRQAAGTSDNAAPLAARDVTKTVANTSGPVAQGLLDIKLADSGFETDHFLSGARAAYEMIVTAFAKGDRATLKPLLGDDVYHAFDSGIAQREARHETQTFTFVGLKTVQITHAVLKDNNAEVTVSFEAQFISATRDQSGAVVAGDPKAVRDVTDVWTFCRDVRAHDPNWLLIATSGGEP